MKLLKARIGKRSVAMDAPGTVLQVFQKGYTIADRVLRPAMVAVATAPAPKDDGAAPAAQA